MKLKYFKSIVPAVVVVISLSVTSCVNDLNVTPIDPNISTTFDQSGVFNKIYATMGLTGQKGPSGDGDVDGIDEGTSDFFRLIWNLNEMPTDEAMCCWGDVGIPELNYCSWGASHSQVAGLYYRLYFDITLCNFFLEQTSAKTDTDTATERAEARFIRALNYYYLLDMWGNVPIVTTVSTTKPLQSKRADVYAFVVKELTDIESSLSDKPLTYGRASKVADWLLLSRLYLNAQVYTGTADWANAKTYAGKVMSSSYSLCPKYSYLFMADNDTNGAQNEIILPILQDGVTTQNYGGSLFLIASTHKSDMTPYGTTEGWAGNRCRPQFVAKFFPNGDAPLELTADQMATKAGDNRAMLYSVSRSLDITTTADFTNGFSCAKFSNIRSDGGATHDSKFVDMDVPLMRVAEAYLTFAEASVRINNGISTDEARDAINTLRTRANASTKQSYSLSDILDEWSREFFYEGRRRSDLIRFGEFGGNTDYKWQWKGGVMNGTSFSKNYNLFPIPKSDMNANDNLVQNPGY
jgi:hypothetical protein